MSANMNILTFDIEEWYIDRFLGRSDDRYLESYDSILNSLLEVLNENQITATFFCLGKVGELYPHIIKRIHGNGHEIGCHSNQHIWLTELSEKQMREDTKNAIDTLENLIGEKVVSYRAPAFSICEKNKWSFEILRENGIDNDSSIFPGFRDFGGYPSFGYQEPVIVRYNGIEINEFPVPLTSLPIIQKKIAFSGGGYFRFLPLFFIKNTMKKSNYNMTYFHLVDLTKKKNSLLSKEEYESYFKEPGSFKNRVLRHFKSNIGKKRAFKNLNNLLKDFQFHSIKEYNELNKIEISMNI